MIAHFETYVQCRAAGCWNEAQAQCAYCRDHLRAQLHAVRHNATRRPAPPPERDFPAKRTLGRRY